jgi:hypothetical protein
MLANQARGARMKERPGRLNLESLWQDITSRYDMRGERVPWRWRMIRRIVARVFMVGSRWSWL